MIAPGIPTAMVMVASADAAAPQVASIIAQDPSTPTGVSSILQSLGVLAGIVVVAYWFLRREDQRDRERRESERAATDTLRSELAEARNQLAELQREYLDHLRRDKDG